MGDEKFCPKNFVKLIKVCFADELKQYEVKVKILRKII